MNAQPRSQKNEEPQDSRTALIVAAKRLFAQHGYDGTTVKDIAEAAGVNVGLISYIFDGKEGLYRSCLAKFGQQNLEVARRVLQPPRSKEEVRIRLQMFFEELTNAHLAEPEVTSILHRECSLDFPVAQELFKDSFLPIFQQLFAFISVAAKDGLLREGIDPLIATSIHFSSLTNAFRMDSVAKKYFGVTLENKDYRARFLKQHLESTLLDLGVPL